MPTVPDLLNQAARFHQSGQLALAEPLYRQVLQEEPAHADAHHLLGILARQAGQHQAAIALIARAIALKPDAVAYHFNLGMVYMDLGQLPQAAQCFQNELSLNPKHVDSYVNLGIARVGQGQLAEAAHCYEQALAINPNHADAHNNLGIVFARQQQADRAIQCFRQALRSDPLHAQGQMNLGNALRDQGSLPEAIACYRQALAINPKLTHAHYHLGSALLEQKQVAEAAECFRHALGLSPNHLEARHKLGIALFEQKQLDESVECFRQALRLSPNLGGAHNNLGLILFEQGKLPEAAECFRQTLRLNPKDAEAHVYLGDIFRDQGLLDEAANSYQQALQLNPNDAATHGNLGYVRKHQGRLDDAVACYQRARDLDPTDLALGSQLLFTMLYHPRYEAPALFEEHRRWAGGVGRHPGDGARRGSPDPAARLRIGYISPDFRDHVVGRNVWPLLSHHDHAKFEITLYANSTNSDALTGQFQKCADHWCPIAGWTDDQVVDRIRKDDIDILVDLTLHTGDNRLLVFARKPAPVQLTFAGYPGGTGLEAIDYRLTDPYLDPPGLFDEWFAETSYRLPHSFWCYDPFAGNLHTTEAPVAPLPALKNGFVTFGCLNNFCKINDGVLELWSRVLHEVTGARLVLRAHEGSHRQRTLDFFARQGVAAERVKFCTPRPRPEYLELFHQVDIGLDTFPYNGHTTSLDSFWMGVPVITLVGNTPVGRAGWSQLTNLGLTELAATSAEDFIGLASDWAADLDRLKNLRGGLRERMRQSQLMDAVGFTRGIEQAYRDIWGKWCTDKSEIRMPKSETNSKSKQENTKQDKMI